MTNAVASRFKAISDEMSPSHTPQPRAEEVEQISKSMIMAYERYSFSHSDPRQMYAVVDCT